MATHSILILENEALIALDLETTIKDAGFHDVTVVTSCADCFEYLERRTPSLALLDLYLNDGDCTEVAHVLAFRNVPFIVCTGSARSEAGEVFKGRPWLAKPWTPDDALDAINKALVVNASGSTPPVTSAVQHVF
ncbi:response regulator [Pararhizobium sp. DWP3-4]|uniref:response regulator n=1 Tax=Pararhizobium sp. DWP3-4 TaxID=2804565 RepID=UPI003CF26E62